MNEELSKLLASEDKDEPEDSLHLALRLANKMLELAPFKFDDDGNLLMKDMGNIG